MRVIVVNRKRFSVTMIIIGLMMVLFGFEMKLDGRLKYTALMENNINSLKVYEGLNKTFIYKLPSKWTTQEYNFGGEEVIYHNDFVSDDAITHGMVEVWNIKEDLRDFLDKSKSVSEETNQPLKDYSVTPITVKKHEGYLVSYSEKSNNGNYFKAYEYFLKDKNKFFRFSFFVREDNFKENMPTIYKTIVETFNYKE